MRTSIIVVVFALMSQSFASPRDTLLQLINGELAIKEAMVTRTLYHSGTSNIMQTESYRFGIQPCTGPGEKTYFCEVLGPRPMTIGASDTMVWTIGKTTVMAAPRRGSFESTELDNGGSTNSPEGFNLIGQSKVRSAMTGGFSQIAFNSLKEESPSEFIAASRYTNKPIHLRIVESDNGRPTKLAISTATLSHVIECKYSAEGIPTRIHRSGGNFDTEILYHHLQFGINSEAEAGGYVPSMFIRDSTNSRNAYVFTNNVGYTLGSNGALHEMAVESEGEEWSKVRYWVFAAIVGGCGILLYHFRGQIMSTIKMKTTNN